MRRLISITAVTATLAISAFALASGSSTVAKENEPRDGTDDRHIELVGKEDELRNGQDNGPDDKIVGRENELRDGADNGGDDNGGGKGADDQGING